MSIDLVRDGNLHWLVAGTKRLVGYASRTRAEAFKAGYEAQQRGEGREGRDRYPVPLGRADVDGPKMRDAWLDGWHYAANYREKTPPDAPTPPEQDGDER